MTGSCLIVSCIRLSKQPFIFWTDAARKIFVLSLPSQLRVDLGIPFTHRGRQIYLWVFCLSQIYQGKVVIFNL